MLSLKILIKPEFMSGFLRLFLTGVRINTHCGISIREFICDQLGVDVSYFDNRIQTIFLNGKAIDSPENTHIQEGSTLAMSAAMPGLVGSTFRKKGVLASFRSNITHQADSAVKMTKSKKTDWITIKLFNYITRELGPNVLERGVSVKVSNLKEVLNSQQQKTIKTGLELADIKLNDKPIEFSEIEKNAGKEDWIYITVHSK